MKKHFRRYEKTKRFVFRGEGYNDGKLVQLDETRFGIQCFRSPQASGFSGTIKQRFSDFIVREIDSNGIIVRLTDVKRFQASSLESKIPKVQTKSPWERIKQNISEFLCKTSEEMTEFNRNVIVKIIQNLFFICKQRKKEIGKIETKKQIDNVLQFIQTELNNYFVSGQLREYLHKILEIAPQPSKGKPVATAAQASPEFYFPHIADKALRSKIHGFIRTEIGKAVVSDTVQNQDGESVIRLRRLYLSGNKRKDIDRRSSQQQSEKGPEYLQFVLYKRNFDTNVAINALARAMKCNTSHFGYSGTKDKRGITSQLCTLYRGSRKRLENLNRFDRPLSEFQFLVGNITPAASALRLGDLQGNQFSVAIRQLPSEDIISNQKVVDAVEAWKSYGFINYFGLQRFGTKHIATHEIGRALLRQDSALAVELLMKPQLCDPSKIHQARSDFGKNKNLEKALAEFPPYLVAERAILKGFQKHGISALGQAVQNIPRTLRMMYTHSYQSLVWNRAVSERLCKYSTKQPIIGDLVLARTDFDDARTDEDVENDAIPFEDTEDLDQEREIRKKPRNFDQYTIPTLITEENQSQFSIEDVVLPLPGYSIQYPQNEIGQFYQSILAEDKVDFDRLERTLGSEYHLPGSYRRMICKPHRVEFEIKRYDDPEISLWNTDVDIIEKQEAQSSVPNGKMRALCLQFELERSSYATIALRDLMKQSSGHFAEQEKPDDTQQTAN